MSKKVFFAPKLKTKADTEYLEYEPNKIYNIIENVVDILASYYNLNYKIAEIAKEVDVIKYTALERILMINFYNDDSSFVVMFEIPILKKLANGAFFSKGTEYYIIKGIRETLWDQKAPRENSRTKLRILNYEIDPQINSLLKLGIKKTNIDHVKGFLSYQYTKHPEEFETDFMKDFLKVVPLKKMTQKQIEAYETQKFNFFIPFFKILFTMSGLVKEYATTISELIAKTACLEVADYRIHDDVENGLNLVHKKVMSETELFISGIVAGLIDILSSTYDRFKRKSKNNKTEKPKKFVLSPGEYLYDYLNNAEQFCSPFFFLSQLNKVTLVGKEMCYLNDGTIKESNRDVHLTHYGNLDPFTTSDKDNTGIQLWLSTSIKLDKYGRFVNTLEKEKMIISKMLDNGLANLPHRIIEVEKGIIKNERKDIKENEVEEEVVEEEILTEV